MRDVTPVSQSTFLEIFSYLKNFARSPLKGIRTIPDWSWGRVITLQIILAEISGVLSSIFTTDFSTWKLAQGVFFFPIIATLIGLVLSSFFYYYFQVFEKRKVELNRLAIMVFLSMTVFYLFHVLSGILAVFDLLGMAFSGILLIVGLTENFKLEKGRSVRVVGILFLLIFMIWAFEKYRNVRLVRSVDSGTIEPSL